MDLIKLGVKTYCIPGVVNMGIYLLDEENICLIDSGSDKTYAKKVIKVLNENNWNLKYIINTHSHADHIGGNKLLQERYTCNIFSKGEEVPFINFPIFEPVVLYGANPVSDLKNKFLMAETSVCKDIKNIKIDGLKIIDLPGHAASMIGVLTDDNVLFTGDAYTSEEILKKYTIQYIYDIEAYMDTLEYLKTFNCNYFVPAHGNIDTNIDKLLELNINNCLDIKKVIDDIVVEKVTYDKLLKQIFDYYHIKMNIVQYYLIGTTIKSFLANMHKEEKITFDFEDNIFTIRKVF